MIDALNPYCAQIRAVDPGQEQMIMKLVCLVPKDGQQRFEEGVQQAARKFDDHYTFRYSGPRATLRLRGREPRYNVVRTYRVRAIVLFTLCVTSTNREYQTETTMFLLDDILLAPVKGLTAICRKIQEAARQDFENQDKAAMTALGELHRRLETGQIEEQDFDAEETRLLEKIESIQRILHPEPPV